MMEVWTKKQLDESARGGCQVDGCGEHGPLHLKARCHMRGGRGMDVRYENGVLSIRCAVCEKPVVDVAVEAHERTMQEEGR